MPQIAIISDSHDNPARIDQMFKILKEKNIETIIHCGDVCSSRVLDYLSNNFKGKIYLSLGNVDADHEIYEQRHSLTNIKIFPKFGEVKIGNLDIAFVHFPNRAKELAQTGKYDFVFHGHTHKPWEEEIDNCKIINPGTLAGLFTRSTFAILDTKTKKVELVIL
jgi:uncharacterized protein